MKLLLSALCASFMVVPAFASECEKGKCDKEKQEEGTLAGKCEKDGDCDKDKEEGALADCDKCKKGDEKKEEGTLAGKCEKDGDCDKEKEEGTLAGKCEKGGDCDKDKEEGTLARSIDLLTHFKQPPDELRRCFCASMTNSLRPG